MTSQPGVGGEPERINLGDGLPLSFAVLEAMAVFLGHVIVFHLLFSADALPIGVDGYYHFTIASQLSLSNPAVDISSLPFTALGANGPDAHWLIHWLQKPLTLLGGTPREALATATLLWAALVPAALTLMLRLAGVRMAALFAVLGVWSLYSLPERFLMFRAQNIAVLLVAGLAMLAGKRRLLLLGLLIFLFNHSYQGVVLAGLVVTIALVTEAVVWRRLNTRLITAAAVGLFLSIVTSPWFPGNLHYFITVTLGRLLVPVQDISLMGTEWFSMPLGVALKAGASAHLFLVGALAILVSQRHRIRAQDDATLPLLFTLLAGCFLVLYLRHWRMGEFYGPLAAMALAFTVCWRFSRQSLQFRAALVCVSLAVLGVQQFSQASPRASMGELLAEQCQILNRFAVPGDMVFNTSWQHYSNLMWCAPQLLYISGLDGMLLAQGDAAMFNQWYLLNKGALDRVEPARLQEALERSGARFILVKADTPEVAEYLLGHVSGARMVVANDDGYLLVLTDAQDGG